MIKMKRGRKKSKKSKLLNKVVVIRNNQKLSYQIKIETKLLVWYKFKTHLQHSVLSLILLTFHLQ